MRIITTKIRITLTVAYLLSIYCTLGIARPIVEYLRPTGLLLPAVIVLFTGCMPLALFWRYRIISRTRFLLRILLIIGLLCAAFLIAALPEERLHFLTYGLAGWLICWSLEATPLFSTLSQKNRFLIWLIPCLLVWAAGGIDELIQWWLPNRVFDIRDIVFNATAGITGIALFATGLQSAEKITD
ncbi:MAG: VanZ family protein [Candidatus Electrothrix sp. AUS1_2]|nr:VanZ family protein [Candidatus Electrothrix sp. AUS1_2]